MTAATLASVVSDTSCVTSRKRKSRIVTQENAAAMTTCERLVAIRAQLAAAYDALAVLNQAHFDLAWDTHQREGSAAASLPWLAALAYDGALATLGAASAAIVGLEWREKEMRP